MDSQSQRQNRQRDCEDAPRDLGVEKVTLMCDEGLSQNPFYIPDLGGGTNNGGDGGNGGHQGDVDAFDSSGGDWTFVKSRKRQKISSSGASCELFDSFNALNTDNKLCKLYAELNEQNSSTKNIERKVDQCLQLIDRVTKLEDDTAKVDSRILLLEYKSLDLEARSRRNNLLFNGLEEERLEDCRVKIEGFIREKLGLVESSMVACIQRAHRLGRYVRGSTRAVIVSFRDYTMVESVLSQSSRLRGTPYSVNRDFPREIAQARRAIWGQYKDLRRQNPDSRVRMVYPAKVMVDGRAVVDKFPMWDRIMSGNRVSIEGLHTASGTQRGARAGGGRSGQDESGVSNGQAVAGHGESYAVDGAESAGEQGPSGSGARRRSPSVAPRVPPRRHSRSPRRRGRAERGRSRAPCRGGGSLQAPRGRGGRSVAPGIRRPWDSGGPPGDDPRPGRSGNSC